jgi:hypothetical protein
MDEAKKPREFLNSFVGATPLNGLSQDASSLFSDNREQPTNSAAIKDKTTTI